MSSTTQPHSLAPSAAVGTQSSYLTHGVKTETYESASPEIKALIRQLNRLAQAETLEEHQTALQGFDEDVILDTPFVQLHGRERVRILATLAKTFLGTFEIEPRLVTITVPEGPAAKGGKLDVEGMLHWKPHRPWFVPITLLLPKDIPIFSNVSLGIKAHNDKVFFVSGKNHNLPHVPRILRVIAGWVVGTAVSVTEPAVNNLLDWYRAGAENVHSARVTAVQSTQEARSTVASAVESVRDTAGNLIENAQERVAAATDTAKSIAAKVAGTVTGNTPSTNTGLMSTPVA